MNKNKTKICSFVLLVCFVFGLYTLFIQCTCAGVCRILGHLRKNTLHFVGFWDL